MASKIHITRTDTFLCDTISILHPDLSRILSSEEVPVTEIVCRCFPFSNGSTPTYGMSLLVRLSGKCVLHLCYKEQPLIFSICIAFRSCD